jgi:N-acetylmuramoyl-L-alanine amidase
MIVCIDPGHVGFDSGNVNSGRKETDYTWPVSLFFQEALVRCGIQAALTRDKNKPYSFGSLGEELSDRANFANRMQADLFVSWHNDSFTNPEANGVAVWICNAARGTETQEIARKIVDAISAATGQTNRGVRIADYAVLVQTNMHAVLIEAGFASNPEENKKLADPEFQKMQAEAAARAVCEYFRVTYIPPAESQPAGTPIIGTAQATVEQAQTFFEKKTGLKLV